MKITLYLISPPHISHNVIWKIEFCNFYDFITNLRGRSSPNASLYTH